MTPLHESSLDNFDRVIRTNVRGVLVSMQHEIPAMLETGGGETGRNRVLSGL